MSMHRAAQVLVVVASLAALAAGADPGRVAASPAVRASERAREPVVGLPCEGCEDVFLGMPHELAPAARIAPVKEPGAPMRIEGTVRDAAQRPVAGIIVYAYHTDDRGIYPRATGPEQSRHGRLRGWTQTGADGRYRFDTIRPAGYPQTTIPAHVHMHVVEPGCCTYFIAEIEFNDDARLGSAARERAATGRGGSGLVTPRQDANGVWLVTRDIVLGEGVPGYPVCGAARPPDHRD